MKTELVREDFVSFKMQIENSMRQNKMRMLADEQLLGWMKKQIKRFPKPKKEKPSIVQ